MKKTGFFLGYFLLPILPFLFYLKGAGTGLDSYSFSVFFGIFTFILICNQFILASRPRWIVNTIGTKGVIALHGTAPVFILILAVIHSQLKEANGFPDSTLQAHLGGIALMIFIIATVGTVFLMANTFWMKIAIFEKFKKWVYAKTGMTYKRARTLHNVMLVAAVIIMVHVVLASSSSFSINPFGISFMAIWMIAALGMYISYRIKGRLAKGN